MTVHRQPDAVTTTRSTRARRASLVVVFGLGIALAATGAAFAYWIITANAPAADTEAAAQTLPTGATPSASIVGTAGQTVTITFAQSSSSGATTLGSYSVLRFAAGSGTGSAISGNCSLTSGTVTCTDAPGAGTWQYTDTPQYGANWVGSASAKSTSLVVQALPTITIPSMGTVTYGGADTPSATLSGATSSPAASGTIALSVYGPASTAPSSCSGAGWSAIGTAVSVSGPGTYNPSTGFTPSSAGSYYFHAAYSGDTYNAAAASTCSNAAVVDLAVAPASLPAATVYSAYSQSVTASGGTSPYTYALTSGTLPTGLTLSSAGTISGTITAAGQAGSFGITVTATDHTGLVGSAAYTLVVNAPSITLSSLSNPAGEVTDSASVTASGGQSAYTYAVTSGSLPTGLSLASGGSFSGSPSAAGSYTFIITATDTHGYTGSRSYTLVPTNPTFTITPASPFTAIATIAFTQSLSTSGGVGPYTYAITSGTLPGTIALSSAGVFSGSTSTTGTTSITITATDNDGFSGSANDSLVVVPALGATKKGSNFCSGLLVSSCATSSMSLTSGAPELIAIYTNTSSILTGLSVGSVSGPSISGAAAISGGSKSFSSNGYLFEWLATGTATSGAVTVSLSGLSLGSAAIQVDVIQLSGTASSGIVKQTPFTNSGSSSPATVSLSGLTAGDGAVAFVGTTANSTFTTPSGASLIDSGNGSGYGFAIYAYDPAASSVSVTMGTSGVWGAIGTEIAHG